MGCCGSKANDNRLATAGSFTDARELAGPSFGDGAWGPPGGPQEPTADIDLTIECHNLKTLDWGSKSDPVVVVYAKDEKTGAWKEHGRTEVIMDDPNPKFARHFKVQYFFEKTQWFRFECYDADAGARDLSTHDYIGSSGEVRLCDIVAGVGGSINFALRTASELAVSGDVLRFGHACGMQRPHRSGVTLAA
jgi:hypothetical protein